MKHIKQENNNSDSNNIIRTCITQFDKQSLQEISVLLGFLKYVQFSKND